MAARMPPEALERIVERLERAAAELRSGDLAPERAAALVDECARLAAEAGGELDREVRAADAGPGPAGQLALEP
jgi:exonuclease VII small subunit